MYASVIIMYIAVGLAVPTFSAPISTSSAVRNVVPESQGSGDLGAREPSPFTLPTSFSDFEDDLDKIPGVSGILGGTAAPPAESPAATQPKCTGVCA